MLLNQNCIKIEKSFICSSVHQKVKRSQYAIMHGGFERLQRSPQLAQLALSASVNFVYEFWFRRGKSDVFNYINCILVFDCTVETVQCLNSRAAIIHGEWIIELLNSDIPLRTSDLALLLFIRSFPSIQPSLWKNKEKKALENNNKNIYKTKTSASNVRCFPLIIPFLRLYACFEFHAVFSQAKTSTIYIHLISIILISTHDE